MKHLDVEKDSKKLNKKVQEILLSVRELWERLLYSIGTYRLKYSYPT